MPEDCTWISLWEAVGDVMAGGDVRLTTGRLRVQKNQKPSKGVSVQNPTHSGSLSIPPGQQLVDPIDLVFGDATEHIG
jgi:hypothetical protein